jgi:hypothetical protein
VLLLLLQVVCALQTHQPALAAAAGAVGAGTPAAEVPMLRFKVAPGRSLQQQQKHGSPGETRAVMYWLAAVLSC